LRRGRDRHGTGRKAEGWGWWSPGLWVWSGMPGAVHQAEPP